LSLGVWREVSTIPAALEKYLYFVPKRAVRVIVAQCNNDTRGELDPYPAFIGVGPEGEESWNQTSLVKTGYVCSYGDLIWDPKTEVVLGPDQQIVFRISGVLADDVVASVLYAEIKEPPSIFGVS